LGLVQSTSFNGTTLNLFLCRLDTHTHTHCKAINLLCLETMFPLCLETRSTQFALRLFEIRNLSLQPLQGPVLGAVTRQDLWKRADIAV
jgi:hypothetical protein